MTEQPRQPVGIPGGGQFAATAHAEPDITLEANPVSRPVETQRRRRGHDFYPPAREMAGWPALYSTEQTPAADKPIMAHYFQGSMEWYIAEYDPQENEAFGYADLGFGHGEWGYIQLGDIEELRGQFGLPIERDLDFKPGARARDCIAKYRDAPVQPAGGEPADDEEESGFWDGPDEPDQLSPEDRQK